MTQEKTSSSGRAYNEARNKNSGRKNHFICISLHDSFYLVKIKINKK